VWAGYLVLVQRKDLDHLDDFEEGFAPHGAPSALTYFTSLAAVALCTLLLEGPFANGWWRRLRRQGGGQQQASTSGPSPAPDGKIGFSYSCLFGDRESAMSAGLPLPESRVSGLGFRV